MAILHMSYAQLDARRIFHVFFKSTNDFLPGGLFAVVAI